MQLTGLCDVSTMMIFRKNQNTNTSTRYARSLCHNFARTICTNVSQSANRARAQRLQTLVFIQLTTNSVT